MSRANKAANFAVGARVRLLVAKEPYYSGYSGNPRVVIPKGTVGVVGAVRVPPVTVSRAWQKEHPGQEPPDFNCVDFVIDGVFQGDERHGNNNWRCAVYDHEMELEEDDE